MRKHILLILLCFICSVMPTGAAVAAEENVVYEYVYGETQGNNNFYYCMLNQDGTASELSLVTMSNGTKRWKTATSDYPMIKEDCMVPGVTEQVCLKFTAPQAGTIRLNNTVSMMIRNTDGTAKGVVDASIKNGSETLWSASLKGSAWSQSYDIYTSVNAGDNIYFAVDSCGGTFNDLVIWFPTVEYLPKALYQSDLSRNINGVDNFYFCSFGKAMVRDLIYFAEESRWKHRGQSYPMVKYDIMMPDSAEPVGLRFVSPRKGMVKLEGVVSLKYTPGNVRVSIEKGGQELWFAQINKDVTSVSYELTNVPLAHREQIYFKVDANGGNSNDFAYWTPSVEYVEDEYEEPANSSVIYYQKDNEGGMTQLDGQNGTYMAADGIAYISSDSVKPSESYSLVKRFTVGEWGRYRILAHMYPQSVDMQMAVYKNGTKVWEQLFPKGEEGTLDVRIMAEADDCIDTEVCSADAEETEWDCNVSEYLGTLFCDATVSAGQNFTEVPDSQVMLGDMLTDKSSCEVYSVKFGQKYPMQFDAQNRVWNNTVGDAAAAVSNLEVSPGALSDTVAEIALKNDGILRIDGNMYVFDASDGVVSKIYLNDDLIWSSRVGGERAVRWNEPFDISYFNNKIDVAANVKNGDKLKLTFNRWRNSERDIVDISDVRVRYIAGDMLSDTTLYKIKKSTIFDANNKKITDGGSAAAEDVILQNEKVYIRTDKAREILGDGCSTVDSITENGEQYTEVKTAAESMGKSYVKLDSGVVATYDSIPVMFGYSEQTEIGVALKNQTFYSEITNVQ